MCVFFFSPSLFLFLADFLHPFTSSSISSGHGAAVKYVQSFNRPLLVLGGGGYTIRNVSRCWTYETSVLLGENVSNKIPFNDSYEFWAPDYELHLKSDGRMPNLNTVRQLDSIKERVIENLRYLKGAPCVQMTEVPPDHILYDEALKIATETRQSKGIETQMKGGESAGAGENESGTSKRRHPAEFYAGRTDQDGSSSSSSRSSSSIDADGISMGRGGAAPAAASASSVAPPPPAVLANQRKSSDTKSSVATSAAALAAGISIQETY